MRNDLVNISNELSNLFKPTEEMEKAKARLLVRLDSLPMQPQITASLAISLTGVARIESWWRIEGFIEWFTNKDEYKERVEHLYRKSLNALEEILLNTDIKAQGARINAIKLLVELADKLPNRAADTQYADAAIAKMDKNQLVSFLEKQGIKIETVKAIEGEVLNESEEDK